MATGIRNLLENNQMVGYIVVAVAALLAGYLLVSRLMANPYAGPNQAYFYNLSTDQILVMSSKKVPPVDLGDGEQAVLAHMYGCGECGSKSELKVGYLERKSDAVKALLEKYSDLKNVPYEETGPLVRADYQMVATPEKAKAGDWMPSGNSNGLLNSLNGECEDGTPKVVCVP